MNVLKHQQKNNGAYRCPHAFEHLNQSQHATVAAYQSAWLRGSVAPSEIITGTTEKGKNLLKLTNSLFKKCTDEPQKAIRTISMNRLFSREIASEIY